MVTLFVWPAKIRAAAGSLKYYGHVPLGEREITIVSSWTRWIHKSELVLAGKVPIGLTYIRLEMTVDRAWHSLRTLISSRMLKLFQPRSYVSNFLYHFDLRYVYICIRQRARYNFHPFVPWLNVSFSFRWFNESRKESSSNRTRPPWLFYYVV